MGWKDTMTGRLRERAPPSTLDELSIDLRSAGQRRGRSAVEWSKLEVDSESACDDTLGGSGNGTALTRTDWT